MPGELASWPRGVAPLGPAKDIGRAHVFGRAGGNPHELFPSLGPEARGRCAM